MIQPITYKLVTSQGGQVQGLELWQGDQHITVGLGFTEEYSKANNPHKWTVVKEEVDAIQNNVQTLSHRSDSHVDKIAKQWANALNEEKEV